MWANDRAVEEQWRYAMAFFSQTAYGLCNYNAPNALSYYTKPYK